MLRALVMTLCLLAAAAVVDGADCVHRVPLSRCCPWCPPGGRLCQPGPMPVPSRPTTTYPAAPPAQPSPPVTPPNSQLTARVQQLEDDLDALTIKATTTYEELQGLNTSIHSVRTELATVRSITKATHSELTTSIDTVRTSSEEATDSLASQLAKRAPAWLALAAGGTPIGAVGAAGLWAVSAWWQRRRKRKTSEIRTPNSETNSNEPSGDGVERCYRRLRGDLTKLRTRIDQMASQEPQVIVKQAKRDREFVEIDTGSKRLQALQKAMDEYVSRNPGARATIETLEAFADQFESGDK